MNPNPADHHEMPAHFLCNNTPVKGVKLIDGTDLGACLYCSLDQDQRCALFTKDKKAYWIPVTSISYIREL